MNRDELLSFAWWNTGLCPPRKQVTHTSEQLDCAHEVVRQLVEVESVDLLALGEVATGQAERIQAACRSTDTRRLLVDARPDGKSQRNLAVLYNGAKLQLDGGPRALFDSQGGSRLHVGMHLLFSIHPFPAPLHVFVVHWPSRMRADSSLLRAMIGRTLQDRIDELLRSAQHPLHVLVLGDFNDEPFNDSMSGALLGSRDRNLVRKRPRHLYNPFWRLLGERQGLEEESGGRLGAGTHYYEGTVATHWHTYDQFLVSASLLAGSGWVLREAGTRIWQRAPLLSPRGRFTSRFDHFPILGMLSHVAPAETPGA
ncbi:endonuclease/exonuclease/phosphatase family protein [Archangium sp.]|jgi:hypothetical protein|uniref:endonuclease/exonuclease/phosphatase family protein n=1 Tax=Archangium sp. TaxID=1872627 RepID=UPI002ED854EE